MWKSRSLLSLTDWPLSANLSIKRCNCFCCASPLWKEVLNDVFDLRRDEMCIVRYLALLLLLLLLRKCCVTCTLSFPTIVPFQPVLILNCSTPKCHEMYFAQLEIILKIMVDTATDVKCMLITDFWKQRWTSVYLSIFIHAGTLFWVSKDFSWKMSRIPELEFLWAGFAANNDNAVERGCAINLSLQYYMVV